MLTSGRDPVPRRHARSRHRATRSLTAALAAAGACDGHVRINNRNNPEQVVDVSDVSTADNAAVHPCVCDGSGAQSFGLTVRE
ncbi:RICIN domain-containing protein [Streptomyces formicae]|uniref:Uncharacterized protein n=1 Tax=Streptomyces formicae TaxID=1616117 RepID=A0ABY3X1I1_9ACTN|nr:RICIN domain-containing protein [Streptomyces formicae]UNM16917.1 hypothetical protein J4032_19960 [Streptomyces formicae]